MPIAVTQEWKGTTEEYQQVCDKLGLTPMGPGPAGSLSHWATQIGDRIRTSDVWVDRETCDAFYQRVDAASKELGLPEPDEEPQYFDVFNIFTAGSDTPAQGADYPTAAATSTQQTSKS